MWVRSGSARVALYASWFDKDGETIAEAREWFAVPLEAFDEAIHLIESEAIQNYEYDIDLQAMRLRS